MNNHNLKELVTQIKRWGADLGFSRVGIGDIDIENAGARLQQWLDRNFHGDMNYMARHGSKRHRPNELIENTLRVISVQMNYLTEDMSVAQSVLADANKAYISRYALGRDYHKLMRRRLQKLADKITERLAAYGDQEQGDQEWAYRAFCDSAPVMEKPLAEKAAIGWMGKHTNILNRTSGSWFFLGEIYTDLPLPLDNDTGDSQQNKVRNHCGSCTACIDVCPTQAIVAPYLLDARKCISYLTIEFHGSIPLELRAPIGNRIYGCDDCQLVCPWNRYAKISAEKDFAARHKLDDSSLLDLMQWSEETFLKNTEGSAIRRIGFVSWKRNLAVALGNAPRSTKIIKLLQTHLNHPSEIIREHVEWALDQQLKRDSDSESLRGTII